MEKIYNEEEYFVWFSTLKLKPIIKVQLIKKYKKLKILYDKTKEELNQEFKENTFDNKENKKIIQELTNIQYKNRAKEKLEKMNKLGIKIVSCYDEKYPKNLLEIYDFPICLFYKGNIELLSIKKKIAVIGCRECSSYGKYVAENFSYELAKNNFIVVSGGARGIDSIAHTGAINFNNSTIAILGNSLEYIYPPENKRLEEKILEKGGLLLSEYGIETSPTKYTFPARNRIISGISDGVLVIEAKEKSGTAITVDFALEQGKNIYAIPGNITSVKSEGTNNLIKTGSKTVTKVEDILEDFS